MKALLVIDVDKDELGEAVATITANDITFFARGVIKPLPQKRKTSVDTDLFEQGVNYGWNACLDEIMGEDNG